MLDNPASYQEVTASGTHQSKVAFPDSSVGKKSTCNAGDPGSIPGLGRCPGEGKCYPLQYFVLENSVDCVVHGVAKSWTQQRNFHFHIPKQEYWSKTCDKTSDMLKTGLGEPPGWAKQLLGTWGTCFSTASHAPSVTESKRRVSLKRKC